MPCKSTASAMAHTALLPASRAFALMSGAGAVLLARYRFYEGFGRAEIHPYFHFDRARPES